MPTIQIERRRRGVFGWIVAILFWSFNLLMAVWIWLAFSATSSVMQTSASGAESTGAAIGGGLAVTMILFIWFLGIVILGIMMLFTRGRKIIETVER